MSHVPNDRSNDDSSYPGSASYIRLRELASGGMGRVDLALRSEGRFKRLYAVKRLHPHLQTDSAFREMFMDEARVAGLIRDPNAVSVLDVGEDEQGPFLVMDFVDGLPLSKLLVRAGRMEETFPNQASIMIAMQISKGLRSAHEARGHDGVPLNLVHRDLSPQNILVGYDGIVRITDFGIAKALGQTVKTATGIVKGKFAYMAPEQLRFEPVDQRTDFFAVGILLFEMLAGLRLYKSSDGNDGPRRILSEPPPDIGQYRRDVPSGLVQLLFRLLAKDPKNRPQHATEIVAELEALLADVLVEEDPIELAEFVRELAGPLRQEQQEILQAALEEADSAAQRASLSPPTSQHKTKRSGLWAIGAFVVVGVGLAGAGWALGTTHSSDDQATDSTATHVIPDEEDPVGAAPRQESPMPPIDEPPEAAAVSDRPGMTSERDRRRTVAAARREERASMMRAEEAPVAAPPSPAPYERPTIPDFDEA